MSAPPDGPKSDALVLGETIRAVLNLAMRVDMSDRDRLHAMGVEAGLLIAEICQDEDVPVDDVRALFEASVDQALAHTASHGFDGPR